MGGPTCRQGPTPSRHDPRSNYLGWRREVRPRDHWGPPRRYFTGDRRSTSLGTPQDSGLATRGFRQSEPSGHGGRKDRRVSRPSTGPGAHSTRVQSRRKLSSYPSGPLRDGWGAGVSSRRVWDTCVGVRNGSGRTPGPDGHQVLQGRSGLRVETGREETDTGHQGCLNGVWGSRQKIWIHTATTRDTSLRTEHYQGKS